MKKQSTKLLFLLLLLGSCSVESTSSEISLQSSLDSSLESSLSFSNSSDEESILSSSLNESVSSNISFESSSDSSLESYSSINTSSEKESITPLTFSTDVDQGVLFTYPDGPSGINAFYTRSFPRKGLTKLVLTDFGFFTSGNKIWFNWGAPEDEIYDFVRITVTAKGGVSKRYYAYETDHCTIEVNKFDTSYSFTFDPFYNNVCGAGISCTRYITSQNFYTGLPTVCVSTGRLKNANVERKHTIPKCDYVSSPTGWGPGITNNEYVTHSEVSVFNRNGKLLSSHNEAKIKIRGNSSAYAEKKPYKIKLDKKSDLLKGLLTDRENGVDHEGKEWILLAKGSQILDYSGFLTSKFVGQDYTPSSAYVNLFLNGEYQGAYMLCEAVSRGVGRIDVADDGFIFENDGLFWNEDLYFETKLATDSDHHVAYTIKYPDPDDLTLNSPEVTYLKSTIEEFEKALFDRTTSKYDQLYDKQSFAKWLLVHELLGTWDSGGSNMFLYKYDSTSNSKIKAGPCWDFDSVMMLSADSPTRIKYSNFYYFEQLRKRSTFSTLYITMFRNKYPNYVNYMSEHLNALDLQALNTSLYEDTKRWGSYSTYTPIETQINTLLTYLKDRMNYLKSNI